MSDVGIKRLLPAAPITDDRDIDHRMYNGGDTPYPGNASLTDAELYRLVVAEAIRSGRTESKGAFDLEVRRLSTLDMADQVIEFNRLRPSCRAWRQGNRMMCDCGNIWSAADPDAPTCRDLFTGRTK